MEKSNEILKSWHDYRKKEGENDFVKNEVKKAILKLQDKREVKYAAIERKTEIERFSENPQSFLIFSKDLCIGFLLITLISIAILQIYEYLFIEKKIIEKAKIAFNTKLIPELELLFYSIIIGSIVSVVLYLLGFFSIKGSRYVLERLDEKRIFGTIITPYLFLLIYRLTKVIKEKVDK